MKAQKISLSLALGALAAASSLPAAADTATSSFTVSATVLEKCSVVANDLAFGNVDVSKNTDVSSSVDVKCVSNLPYTVTLSRGANSSGTDRKMAGTGVGGTAATDTLNYEIYSDSNHVNAWTETAATAIDEQRAFGAGLNTANQHKVYGRVPAGQYAAKAGAYSDTITVTITY